MERNNPSPAAAEASSMAASSAASSPGPENNAEETAAALAERKKQKRKNKRKKEAMEDGAEGDQVPIRKHKKPKQKKVKDKDDQKPKKRKQQRKTTGERDGISAAQLAVNEQMRRALEEDQYSANGSIVDTDTDDEDHHYVYKGQSIRLDRSYLIQAARKQIWSDRVNAGTATGGPPGIPEGDDNDKGRGGRKKKKKGKRGKDDERMPPKRSNDSETRTVIGPGGPSAGEDHERDEGSIFGQTTGASNSTWVECDKCKKWRRLRGVVDERKLPPKWYCSMNKNDPERARCSAPEEEYDASHTPESAADARTRKHLRVWVRRLQCNEAYEGRQPSLTRAKKRAAAASSKEPYEWVRCCNPSCGKWRAILKIMDAKGHVLDRCTDGEWYCVMNTWDEKTASCAAPQENLPAVGCPPWVFQDDH